LHKDDGCGSELDYVEQTSWVPFLKYLDDLEKDKKHQPNLLAKPIQALLRLITNGMYGLRLITKRANSIITKR